MNTAMELHNLMVLEIRSHEQYRAMRPGRAVPHFDPELLLQQQADAHWIAVDEEQIVARCSLWWRDTPTYLKHRVGLIGHYAAATDAAARTLLSRVTEELQAKHCTLAVGPMDGNTWRSYRFVTDAGDEPAFFLEPQNAADWPDQFIQSGFRPAASYFSAMVDNPGTTSPRVRRMRDLMYRRGIRIRHWRDDSFERDLRQIQNVVESAFADNLFFAPISPATFVAQFAQLRPVVPRDLVLLAEQSERIVGFCFAVPDLLQAERGGTVDTVILKTLGTFPGRPFAGLGQVLLEDLHLQAKALGFRRVIHALVREKPHLQQISQRYGVPFRRYTLFAKELVR
jgi:hypothetical protein